MMKSKPFDSASSGNNCCIREVRERRSVVVPCGPLSAMCDISLDKDGDTPLHLAVLHNTPAAHLAEAAQLLGWRDQVNHLNHLLQSPLHIAVLTGHIPALSLLLGLGASPLVQDGRGNTPLHTACHHQDLRAVKVLCHPEEQAEEVLDGPWEACEEETGVRGEELCRWREKSREEINCALEVMNYEGVTCLHMAVQNGSPELVAELLRSGADVNAKEGKSGRTALHLAVDTSNPSDSIITLLLLHPHLHINACNFAQQTALQLARGRGHLHLVDLLHVHGADWSDCCHGCHHCDSIGDDDEDAEFVMPYNDLCIAGHPISHPRCG